MLSSTQTLISVRSDGPTFNHNAIEKELPYQSLSRKNEQGLNGPLFLAAVLKDSFQCMSSTI